MSSLLLLHPVFCSPKKQRRRQALRILNIILLFSSSLWTVKQTSTSHKNKLIDSMQAALLSTYSHTAFLSVVPNLSTMNDYVSSAMALAKMHQRTKSALGGGLNGKMRAYGRGSCVCAHVRRLDRKRMSGIFN